MGTAKADGVKARSLLGKTAWLPLRPEQGGKWPHLILYSASDSLGEHAHEHANRRVSKITQLGWGLG